MSAARVTSAGKVYPLDGRTEPDEVVTAEDAQDSSKVARLLCRLLKEIATLKRQWAPRRIDFEGVVCGTIGQSTAVLQHGFGSAVRWWVVGWTGATGVAALVELASGTTSTTIQFQSYTAGTATIRVEEAG